MEYTFGEKKEEYVDGKNLPVWKSPKYEQSKKKAIEIIDSNKYGLSEGDFWILWNTYSNKTKVMYNGLIISHNGCLKINDRQSDEDKFNPECVTVNENGFNNSLVFTYKNKEQGIYEVGEVSKNNCKNQYPYAMAFKRCFDRVVLKISKLAYEGIYSDSEADEFKERYDDDLTIPQKAEKSTKYQQEVIKKAYDDNIISLEELKGMLLKYEVKKTEELTKEQATEIIQGISAKRKEVEKASEMISDTQKKIILEGYERGYISPWTYEDTLKICHAKTIDELTYNQAEDLINQINNGFNADMVMYR